jgi:hypothetical protein
MYGLKIQRARTSTADLAGNLGHAFGRPQKPKGEAIGTVQCDESNGATSS